MIQYAKYFNKVKTTKSAKWTKSKYLHRWPWNLARVSSSNFAYTSHLLPATAALPFCPKASLSDTELSKAQAATSGKQSPFTSPHICPHVFPYLVNVT